MSYSYAVFKVFPTRMSTKENQIQAQLHSLVLLTNSLLSELLLNTRLLTEADVYTNGKEEGEIRRKRQCLLPCIDVTGDGSTA